MYLWASVSGARGEGFEGVEREGWGGWWEELYLWRGVQVSRGVAWDGYYGCQDQGRQGLMREDKTVDSVDELPMEHE